MRVRPQRQRRHFSHAASLPAAVRLICVQPRCRKMEGSAAASCQFDPSDFLLGCCDSPASSASASPEFLRPACLASEARGKFAALRVRLPGQGCASPAAESSHDDGLSPASTASVSEAPSPTQRAAAAAAAGYTQPDSECSEACSSRGSDAGSGADPAPGAEPHFALECTNHSGSRAGTPCPRPAAATFPEGPPQQPCTTPPAFQLAYSGAAEPCGSTGSSSRALTPAGLSQSQQLEVLAARLEAEAEARRAAQRQLAEHRAEAEQQRHALGQEYEARLAALLQQLQQAAEQGAGAVLRRSILAGGGCWWFGVGLKCWGGN